MLAVLKVGGSCVPLEEELQVEVRGRDSLVNLPRRAVITSDDVREALQEPVRKIIGAIKSEVILTFLGLGVKGEPSWGIMIKQSSQEVVNEFFWQIGTATGLMFFLVLAFNIFTDALQDALDPKHIA